MLFRWKIVFRWKIDLKNIDLKYYKVVFIWKLDLKIC